MTTFDEREHAFEAKFARDADVEFRVVARANKLFGLWAAHRLGLNADAADDYARDVVHAEFEAAGHAGVRTKVMADLAARDRGVGEDELIAAMDATLAEARHQIMGNGSPCRSDR